MAAPRWCWPPIWAGPRARVSRPRSAPRRWLPGCKEQGFDCRLASYVNGAAVEAEAAALQPGQVLLLENLRFEKGETKNND